MANLPARGRLAIRKDRRALSAAVAAEGTSTIVAATPFYKPVPISPVPVAVAPAAKPDAYTHVGLYIGFYIGRRDVWLRIRVDRRRSGVVRVGRIRVCIRIRGYWSRVDRRNTYTDAE